MLPALEASPLLQALLLAIAAFVSSAINMIAGGGSFLVLPLLIFFGLPAGEANATNRVGVLAQNIAGVVSYHRHGVLDWSFARPTFLPCILGSLAGAWASLYVGDRELRRVISVLMVLMTLVALLDPSRFQPAPRARRALIVLGFFGAGFYGGFIQAGVGFLLLALTSLLGFDLVRGNAVKVLLALLQVVVSLAIFAWAGRVSWGPGLILAAGSIAGSLVGVRLTVLKGHAWVQRVVTITVVLFAVKLWFD
jgi:uncharacterized membrane protein YfcA